MYLSGKVQSLHTGVRLRGIIVYAGCTLNTNLYTAVTYVSRFLPQYVPVYYVQMGYVLHPVFWKFTPTYVSSLSLHCTMYVVYQTYQIKKKLLHTVWRAFMLGLNLRYCFHGCKRPDNTRTKVV